MTLTKFNKLRVKLFHFLIWFFGDKKLEKEGRVIPCKKCGNCFKSYTHYGEWSYTYDTLCQDCKNYNETNKTEKSE